MSELSWSDIAKLIAEAREKYPQKYYHAIIKPGIYRYLKMMKYHKWKNKYSLWEATK
ncbi:MAG: hypothetical protein WC428_06620 [Candidatus Paceibacterota bacterium]|jgi:hypothetical protein